MNRYFTVEEATAAVQVIKPLMKEVLEIREAILRRKPEVWPVLEKAVGNGGGRAASQLAQEFNRLDGLIRQILETGAVIKDVNSGLVDFLALRDGREIYLCWKYGEEGIAYWHDLDTGFAGRQPI